MAKTKVRLDLKGALGKIAKERIFDAKTEIQLGATTVSMMLDFISKGQSPVKGYGRYVGYAADRKASSAKVGANQFTSPKVARKIANSIRGSSKYYPNSVLTKFPGKKRRPVNLSLNGKFLSTIKHQRLRSAQGVEVGHINPDQFQKDLFATHNMGEHPHVPQRKYLPSPGEEFVISIMRKIREIISLRIKDLIRKSK